MRFADSDAFEAIFTPIQRDHPEPTHAQFRAQHQDLRDQVLHRDVQVRPEPGDRDTVFTSANDPIGKVLLTAPLDHPGRPLTLRPRPDQQRQQHVWVYTPPGPHHRSGARQSGGGRRYDN